MAPIIKWSEVMIRDEKSLYKCTVAPSVIREILGGKSSRYIKKKNWKLKMEITLDSTNVYCSYPKYIRQLLKSEFFIVNRFVVSSYNRDKLLCVYGTLKNGITIRKKIPDLERYQRNPNVSDFFKPGHDSIQTIQDRQIEKEIEKDVFGEK